VAVPAQEMEDDSVLVRAVQAGDLEAYSELFRRHYPSVQRACARRMACPLEAEEIAQAAFVRALERIAQCTGQRQFGGWVQIIARHLCVDALRARSRVVPTESPVLEDRVDGSEPHDSLIDRERRDDVRKALDSLPPRQRQAVTARAQGTGPGQIADDLGLSVGAVDSLILRGRRRLALAYQRVAGEGGATATATSATAAAAASLLAAVSIGSTRLLGGVAAAAEAGRELVAPVASGVAGVIMTVAVAIGGAPAAAPEPATTPTARPPAVVVSAPAPEPPGAATVVDGGPTPVPVAASVPAGAPAGSVVPVAGAVPGATAGATTAAPGAAVAATPEPAGATTTPADPLALPLGDAAPIVEPVIEPVTEVLDTTAPAVVGTVGDVANGAVDTVTGLLPR
jgi:RNA polymerase sigma-70 factor, ECF subfamily